MPAASPSVAPVSGRDETIPSTSCTEGEEAPLVREPQGKARGVWKVAVVATVTGLIAAAGRWWSNSLSESVETVGGEVTGLDSAWYMYGTIGCTNWDSLEISRAVVADKSACAKLCEETQDCTSFNWQAVACEPGWFVSNGCLLFKGNCNTERNVCWELDYKIADAETIVTQALTVQTSATAEEAEAAVAQALADEDIKPVTTSSTAGRRLQQERMLDGTLQKTWIVKWTFKTTDDAKGDLAYNYAMAVKMDPWFASVAFTEECIAALPKGSTFKVISFGEPVKESGGTTETPDWGSTTGMAR